VLSVWAEAVGAPVPGYQDLEVWQRAKELAKLVYRLTEAFPAEERFGMTAQARRAAVAVMSDIAEGAGRATAADFARFVGMAIGSVNELESLLILSHELGLAQPGQTQPTLAEVARVRQMLCRLQSSLARR
jgi:four helix bundle protein